MSVIDQMIQYTVENTELVFLASLFADSLTFAGESAFERQDSTCVPITARTTARRMAKDQESIHQMLSYLDSLDENSLATATELLIKKEKGLLSKFGKGQEIKVKVYKQNGNT